MGKGEAGGGPLRVVLLSCANSPFSAELLAVARAVDPSAPRAVVGVVLSRPRRARAAEGGSRGGTGRGAVGFAPRLRAGLGWRLNRLRELGRAVRRRLPGARNAPWRHIEDVCAALEVPVHTARSGHDAATVEFLRGLSPDLTVMATFNHILRRPLIEVARVATLNVHPSLLPRYRGADPIQAALRDGATETGVTVHWVDEGIDTGDIALQRAVEVPPGADVQALRRRLAQAAGELFVECLDQARAGTLGRTPQPH